MAVFGSTTPLTSGSVWFRWKRACPASNGALASWRRSDPLTPHVWTHVMAPPSPFAPLPTLACLWCCGTAPRHVAWACSCAAMLTASAPVLLVWWAWPVTTEVMVPSLASGLPRGACVAIGVAHVHPAAAPPPQPSRPLGRTPSWPLHPSPISGLQLASSWPCGAPPDGPCRPMPPPQSQSHAAGSSVPVP